MDELGFLFCLGLLPLDVAGLISFPCLFCTRIRCSWRRIPMKGF
ncbi:unnamed protein product [Linum tenue]|uniref:Uncharacterized protein n=1 Tax=Linum tenue TaxID=586396 RepID=A0AAV0LI87_9ROSI|nr:unnamed protein product [Linum tenue]CAI0433971.1 unnamed protein product [Linum tenue]